MPEMPEWVQVWAWLRFLRVPSVLTPLPQQGVLDSMPMGLYENFAAEWRKAGSPSLSVKQLVAAMAGNPLIDDIPF